MIDTKKLGVIGGLGPMATAHFYELVTKMTDAKSDQEHLDMVIFSQPSIPDRTDFILGRNNESPATPMIDLAQKLVSMGVDYLAIPCITAHYFYEDLRVAVSIPMLHIVKETVQHLIEQGIHKVGIMATEGTVQSQLFQMELKQREMEFVLPSIRKQNYVTDLIYQNVKADQPVEMDKFLSVSEEMRGSGAEVIILGCTELSLIKRDNRIGKGFLDAMEVLAMRSVLTCGAKLKEEYNDLITK